MSILCAFCVRVCVFMVSAKQHDTRLMRDFRFGRFDRGEDFYWKTVKYQGIVCWIVFGVLRLLQRGDVGWFT